MAGIDVALGGACARWERKRWHVIAEPDLCRIPQRRTTSVSHWNADVMCRRDPLATRTEIAYANAPRSAHEVPAPCLSVQTTTTGLRVLTGYLRRSHVAENDLDCHSRSLRTRK
jgi:hypothetical protein